MTNTLPDPDKAVLQPLTLSMPEQKGITAAVLRLDLVHPVISGNKWFKLRPYLQRARQDKYRSIVTFGGAWSNHIVAAAYAARQCGLPATGIIRGEASPQLSPTLQAAVDYGMTLQFTGRDRYRELTASMHASGDAYGDGVLVIPEGGFGLPGMKGCEAILSVAPTGTFTHILCCTGTGTMFTGIANSALPHQQVTGISVLKGMETLAGQLAPYLKHADRKDRLNILHSYHFGGYARKTPVLLRFMNDLYEQTGIPTDFVYTAKLLYAFTDLAAAGYFNPGSRVLVIHSGGLQGNASLPPGTLCF